MKSDTRYTPEILVRENMRFSIPLYQRLFAWGEIQVNKLMEDLYEHYKSSLKDCPYYLGQMTIVHKDGCFSLIDGQQRFTVMTLLAIVLKKYPCWKDFFYVNGGERLTFAGRREDQQYIRHKMQGEDKNDMNYSNAKMDQALSCMQKFMDDHEKFGAESEKKEFANWVFNHMSFFFSELPDSYLHDPSSLNRYFETMNSTGKNLESHEILKVELMRGCEDQEYLTRIWNLVSRMEYPIIGNKSDTKIEECRNHYIQAIQNCIKGDFLSALKLCLLDKEEHSDKNHNQVIAEIKAEPLTPQTFRDNTESSVLSFPDFLLLVLDLTNGPKVRNTSDFDFYKRDKLLTRFHDYKPKEIKMLYNNLLMYRLMIDYYVDRVEYIQGVGHHYLIFKDDKDNSNLRQYEAMLHVSTNYYEWLVPFLQFIKENFTHISSSQLLSKLKEIDNHRHLFVDDENAFSYGVVDRYWFWRLDYYLWERRSSVFKDFNVDNDNAILNYEFRANRSIEHLHPQDESNNTIWNKDKYDLNRFGNLAMISQSFNSTQRNDSVKVKFARIEDQAATNDLQSLKLYHMYLSANGSQDGWNEEAAKIHETKMLDILKDSYGNIIA